MDTAQKLLKTSAILLAIALLMAAPGWAQPTLLAPATVVIGATGSSSANVASSDSATAISFTVATSYSVDTTGSGSWLVVTPSGTSTTPAFLTFGLRNGSSSGITSGASARVTLHPTNGAADVVITVTFDTSGGGGSTTLTASTTTVSLDSIVTNATVNITNTSGSTITVGAGWSVTSGSTSWLSATLSQSVISPGSGAILTIYGTAAGLGAGTYQGTVTVTPSTGTPLTINVNFTVGAGSGGAWSPYPSSISWNFTTNSGTYPIQAVTVSTTSGMSAYSVNTTQTGSYHWLLVSANAQPANFSAASIPVGSAFTLSVGSQANSLTEGTYSDRAIITDQLGVQQATVTVSLTVNGGSSTVLTVTPNPLSFNVAVNSAQQSQTVTVTSGAGGTLAVGGCTSLTWLTCTLPSNTSLSPGVGVGFTVYANPAGLAASTNNATLQIQVDSQFAQIGVSMIVGGGGTGTTAVAPTALNFAYQLGTDPLNFVARPKLVITGPAGAWSSSISTINGTGWLNLSPSNGSALPDPADDRQTPIVSIDATGLAAGSYDGTIVIKTLGGSQSISVSLTVDTPTVLLPTPGSLVFSAKTGQPKPSGQIMSFSGSDGALNPLAITAASNNPWIAVTNDASSVTVQVDQSGLTTGVYTGSFSVTQAGAANSPALIPVVLVVNGGGSGGTPPANSNVTVSPTSLTFSAASGSNPATQTIGVTSASGSAGISFTTQVTAGAFWLSTSANTSSTPSTLTVTVNSSALAAGPYSGNILISPTGGTPVNIPVSLTVAATAAVSATPTTLTFNYRAGDSAPAAQQLTVSGSGAAFSATASSNGNWLVVSPTSGATPGTVNVSINPSGLTTGSPTYTGTVLVAGTGGATGSTTVTVTLNFTAPLPTITRVTNAASYATSAIAPGEIITIFASDSSIGPATAAGLALDASGKVSTTIGGVQVTVGGFACPMVYASASQVSAVVPYEIKGFVSATVLVKFRGLSSNGVLVNVATTVPALFTANSSGTGPGAIANSNGSFNAPANPATRGDIVVVYLTGEGETSPAGVTGKVTTVASPPQPLTPAPLLPVSVTIGGQPANWTFAGEAPTFVSGVMQLNLVVPTNIAAGDQPIVVSFGGNPSQLGVTVSVR